MKLRDDVALAALLCLCANPASFAADGPPPDRDASYVLNPLAVKTLDRLPATLARPLFLPTRSRLPRASAVVVQTETPPPSPPPPPPAMRLLGILKTGPVARAALRVGPAANIMLVGVGDQIGGWTVTEIAARQMVLSLNAQTVSVGLFKRLEPRVPPGPTPRRN